MPKTKQEEFNGKLTFTATEAEFDPDEHTATITIVQEGDSINGRNYKKSTLKKAVLDHVYEGVRMFVDHSDKPPIKRSMKELVAGIESTEFVDGNPARIRGKVKFFDEKFEGFAQRAKEHIGVSHAARLMGTRTRLPNGRIHEDIDLIKQVHSVDWVVYPSAGGQIESFYVQEGVEMPDAIDWGAITKEDLEKNAPELVESIKTTVTVKDRTEGVDEPEKEPAPAVTQESLSEMVKKALIEAQESIREEQENKETIAKSVASVVDKSTLPELTKNRIKRQFSTATTFDESAVKEAVDEAKQELAAVAKPKITGMGMSTTGSKGHDLGLAHEAVAAAFGLKKADKNSDKEE